MAKNKPTKPTKSEPASKGHGRPPGVTIYTEDEVAAELIKNNGRIYQTAKTLGINHTTLNTYLNRWPGLREVIKESRRLVCDQVEGWLYEHLKDKNLDAIKFFLKTQGRKRGWTEGRVYQVSGVKNAPPIQTEQTFPIDKLPIELRRQVLAYLTKSSESSTDTEEPTNG